MTVKQVQGLLVGLRYDPGTVDGADGAATQNAVRAFQKAEGLNVDGIAGAMTWEKLKDAVYHERYRSEDAPATVIPVPTGTFWDKIKYFTRVECRCKCGGKYCNGYPAEMQEETMLLADEVRRRAGVPLNNNSALRCKRWNTEQKGVANSNHITGHAIDLAPINGNISVAKLYSIAEEVMAEMIPGRGGLGRYKWGIHIDNGTYSRWTG